MTRDTVLALISLGLWCVTLALYIIGYIRAGRELKRLRERP